MESIKGAFFIFIMILGVTWAALILRDQSFFYDKALELRSEAIDICMADDRSQNPDVFFYNINQCQNVNHIEDFHITLFDYFILLFFGLPVLIGIGTMIIAGISLKSDLLIERSSNQNKGIILLDKELSECEKAVDDFRKSKKINKANKLAKSFYTKLMKLSDMLHYLMMSQSDVEYDMRSARIDKLQRYASKQVELTFEGESKQIAKIKDELSYSAGEGAYFSDEQHDKWWKEYE